MATNSGTRQRIEARPPIPAPKAGDATAGKEAAGVVRQVPSNPYQALTRMPSQVKPLLEQYVLALGLSRQAGGAVSFRVEVDPAGEATVFPVEEASAHPVEEPAPALARALEAARDRGRLLASEILSADDMLSAEAFAEVLGTTRMTVNTKRQNGQLLGLDGAKRGFRFPLWQLDADGKPFPELQALHATLGGPWAVYRFLAYPQGELEGLTGREALERRRPEAVLRAAESVARDFR